MPCLTSSNLAIHWSIRTWGSLVIDYVTPLGMKSTRKNLRLFNSDLKVHLLKKQEIKVLVPIKILHWVDGYANRWLGRRPGACPHGKYIFTSKKKLKSYVESISKKPTPKKRPTTCLELFGMTNFLSGLRIKKWQRFLPASHQEEICWETNGFLVKTQSQALYLVEKQGTFCLTPLISKNNFENDPQIKTREAFGKNSLLEENAKRNLLPRLIHVWRRQEWRPIPHFAYSGSFESNPKKSKQKNDDLTFGITYVMITIRRLLDSYRESFGFSAFRQMFWINRSYPPGSLDNLRSPSPKYSRCKFYS